MSNDDEIQRLQLRLPNDLYEVIKDLADRNFRSANSEILYLVSLGLEKVKECASPDEVRQIVREELAKAGKHPNAETQQAIQEARSITKTRFDKES